MKVKKFTFGLLTLFILASVSMAGGQSKKSNTTNAAKTNSQLVTITLVRWPYT